MDDSTFLILGANGQLGKALQAKYPKAQVTDSEQLDITNRNAVLGYDWSKVSHILNAAAYTNVDGAETAEGRAAAWKVNATSISYLAEACIAHDLTLLHISTDYVFDGTISPHTEEESLSPLGVYGASKAAGDTAASCIPKHYILRASWVIGDGKNFVRSILKLGEKGVSPAVVADQVGRLTFTVELVRAIDHLLSQPAPYGTYNASNDGRPVSWAQIAREIFSHAGFSGKVSDTTAENYFKNVPNAAPRPQLSTLDLNKIKSSGFKPNDWQQDLLAYIDKETS